MHYGTQELAEIVIVIGNGRPAKTDGAETSRSPKLVLNISGCIAAEQ